MFESNRNPKSCRDGKGWSYGIQDGGSGRAQEHEGSGAPGGRFAVDRVPQADGEAMGTKDGRNGVRVDQQQGQLVAQNRMPGIGKMDSEGVEEGLRLCKGRRRDGIKNRPVH